MKISSFFVFLSCVFFLNQSGYSETGSLNKKQTYELQKRISMLVCQKKKSIDKMEKCNKQYSKIRKELHDAKITLREGDKIGDIYNKKGVDKETATLIDRCRAAEKNYAKLRDELEKKLNNSPEGQKKKKMYEEARSKIAGIEQEQLKIIKERTYAAQDIRTLVKKIKQKKAELKALENKTVSAEKASKTE